MVRFLLQHGARADKTDEHGQNVMHLAAGRARVDVMEAVVASIASDWFDFERCVFLEQSTANEYLQRLLESADAEGKTPLMITLENQQFDAATTLVLLGANTWELGSDGMNTLHRVIVQERSDMVQVVLDSIKDVDCKTAAGSSSLMLACQVGSQKLASTLLSAGANVHFCDLNGRTALHLCAEAGNETMVRMLLDNGADSDAVDAYGITPAFCSLAKGHAACLKMMLDNGSDPNRKVGGHSLLYAAACSGDVRLVKTIIDCGCDLFSGSDSGFMPLHAAVYNGNTDAAQLIAAAHAADADSQSNYARIHRIAQCLAVLGNHMDPLLVLHKMEPNANHVQPHDPSVSWNADKLAALLGRLDVLQHLKRATPITPPLAETDAKECNDVPDASPLRNAEKEAPLDLPCTCYQKPHGTKKAFEPILEMLFSEEGTALDLATLCSTLCLNIVKEYHTGEVLVSVSKFDEIVRTLRGEVSLLRAPSKLSQSSSDAVNDRADHTNDETHLDIVELEEEVIRLFFPLPSSARLETDVAKLHTAQTAVPNRTGAKTPSAAWIAANKPEVELPADVESRLRAEDEELLNAISNAQDKVLETRRLTSASMRVLLKRAMDASMAGSEHVAFACLRNAEHCFGQCSVCQRIRRLEPGFLENFAMCKVCDLTAALHTRHRHNIVDALFNYHIEEAGECLTAENALGAGESLSSAKKWLDDILGDSSRNHMDSDAVDKKALQSKWQQVQDRFILAEVTAHTESMIVEVLARDGARRASAALESFCQKMMSLAANAAQLVEAFARDACSSADVSPLIEDVRLARMAFMKAGDCVTKDDHLALMRIAHIIQGLARTSHARTILKDAWSKLDSADGFSLRLARRAAFECQGFCSVSREEFKILQDSPRPQSAAGSCTSAAAATLRKSRTISDVGLMQEMDDLGPRYVEVCSHALEQITTEADRMLQIAGEMETALIQRKMTVALADISREIAAESMEEKISNAQAQMAELESHARQQCETSEYQHCLATISTWRNLSEESILPAEAIAASVHMLNLEHRAANLRQKQVDAESRLEEAMAVLASDAEKAKAILSAAQAEFKGVNEQRPKMLQHLAHVSQQILYAVFKAMVEDELVPAALKSSESASFKTAETFLQSSLYEARHTFNHGRFDSCIAILDKALLGFRSKLIGLAGEFDSTSLESEVSRLRGEATAAIKQDAASAAADQALTAARSLYTGDNFDEVRALLSVAMESAEAAGARLKHHVAQALESFTSVLDYDEVTSVLEQSVRHLEKQHDTATSDMIREYVSMAVESVAAELSDLCSADAETMPTSKQLDQLVMKLEEAVSHATERAATFVYATGQDVLWAAAVALSNECRHLSLCAQARSGTDQCLAAIYAYKNHSSKKLPMKEIESVKIVLQAAQNSAPPAGYSTSYTFPETCGIRAEVVHSLLQRCEEEAEKCINYTKACIVQSQDKLTAAAVEVLAGEFEASECLLRDVIELDMVMTPAFWGRCKEVEAAAGTSRRLAELELLAKQEHADALRLMQDQVHPPSLCAALLRRYDAVCLPAA